MFDFCQKAWKTWKWLIISIVAMISLALGLLGYLNAVRVNNYPTSYANIVYWALRLFTFEMDYIPEQTNWMLEVSRFTSPMVFFYTLWHAIINCGIRVLTRWNSNGMNIGDDLVEKLAEQEHIRRCEERQKDGWRYAPGEKNPTEKTNPCLVLWEVLSEEEKNKDRSAVRNIPIILARFGYEVYKI